MVRSFGRQAKMLNTFVVGSLLILFNEIYGCLKSDNAQQQLPFFLCNPAVNLILYRNGWLELSDITRWQHFLPSLTWQKYDMRNCGVTSLSVIYPTSPDAILINQTCHFFSFFFTVMILRQREPALSGWSKVLSATWFMMVLPKCSWGSIFYLAIATLSYWLISNAGSPSGQ